MSAITIGGDLIHYEKLGRGRPVILVHGWIGSWRYWIPLMQQLHLKYSVYTLDLVGFGDSARNKSNYNIESQVKMLLDFTEQLGIPKAAFVGHALGAMVVAEFARQFPEKAARLLLVNAPLFDPGDLQTRQPATTRQLLTPRNDRYRMAPTPESLGYEDRTIANEKLNRPAIEDEDTTLLNQQETPFHELPTIGKPDAIDREALRLAAETRRIKNKRNDLQETFKSETILSLLERCYKRSEPEFDKLKSDVDRSDNAVLVESTQQFNAGDFLDKLRSLTAPTVIVHGEADPVLPKPKESIWNYLTANDKEDVLVPVPLPNIRHFPMLEHDSFPRLVGDFLSTADISKLEIRERWRRRSR